MSRGEKLGKGYFRKMAKVKKEKKMAEGINPMLFLVVVMLIVMVASYIVPAGSFERVYDEAAGKDIVVPGSFEFTEKSPIKPFALMMSLALGIQNASYIIAFLLIIGGMFAIMEGTGAINAGIANVVRAMRGKELLMIPVLMTVLGLMSCFCANFEEFLAFIPLILAVSLSMGFDSMTALGIVFGSVAAGYGGAATNAFTVGVAQSIAGLPMFSGMTLRLVLFAVLLIVSMIYVMVHAQRVKKNPQLSPSYAADLENAKKYVLDVDNIEKLTGRQKLVLLTLLGAILWTVYGVLVHGYYIDELAAIFLTAGVVAGIVGGSKPSQICDDFIKGAANMLAPCMMIGMANAVVIMMTDAGIIDTIIYALSNLLTGLPSALLACGMFVVQTLFNLAVPSGSGQAAITMPLMAPLADMVGITRQTAVLAFQLGSTFTDIIGPTSGEALVAIAMCKVSYPKWVKWLLPMFCLWCIVAFAFLIFATMTAYGPF